MDARSNLVLKAVALRGDIAGIEEEGLAGRQGGGTPSPRVSLDRLGAVKTQLAGLRRRAGGDPPAELKEASKELGRAEKRLAFRCRGRRGRPAHVGAKVVV